MTKRLSGCGNSRQNFNQRLSAKFTLLELLVVVAIIAILASLLLGVFSRARETSRRASCFSNLRQIGVSMVLYVDSSGDRYPYPVITFGGVSNHGNGFKMFSWPQYLFGSINNTELYYCPSDQTKEKRPKTPAERPDCNVSYQYRFCLGFAAEQQFECSIRTGTFKYPSQQVLIHEQTAWHGKGHVLNKGGTPHDNFAELSSLFMDGHAKAWQMTYYDSSTGCFDANWFGAGDSPWDPRSGFDVVR